MQDYIESRAYSASKTDLCGSHPHLEAVFDAIEWELLRASDFSRYPLVDGSPMGEVRYYLVRTVPPGVVVVFGFEDCADCRKTLLIDCRVPENMADDDP